MQKDAFTKELHEKDEVISELKEASRRDRDRVSDAYRKMASLQERVHHLQEAIRAEKKAVSSHEKAARSAEKRANAQIKRALSALKEPQRLTARRLLSLEWLVLEMAKKLRLPGEEILSLAEVCPENDPALKCAIETDKEEDEDKEDLIAYLDKNGVRSILGIDMDLSLL
ncbi:uncharacterized protein NEMAJ01_2152 [Nematocida major]|uniref:uncharacterized protein n=1 Tax=Nematocida major TaxID=1912982 RepID=UPI002007A77B|nr:uncharacterized protein NEMAJ01_2152 [Nematocida major]KAH9387256.1 hypothetical protein NEMAJ01_2152 [Nematocida major]